jgi:heme oxygenase (biliverdin-IX-beta and delta-forming)
MTGNPAREALRSGTLDCHRRVDEIYSAARLGDRLSYASFLRAQAAAYLPVEAALDRAGIADIIADWPARIRGPLLVEDMAELGVAKPIFVRPPAMDGISQMLGALYVLEGSRLGGRLLKRLVPAHLPSGFLAGECSASWPTLLLQLERMLDTSERRSGAIAAARSVFSIFEESGRRYLDCSIAAKVP